MMLFYLFGHEKPREINNKKKLVANFVKVSGPNGLASFADRESANK